MFAHGRLTLGASGAGCQFAPEPVMPTPSGADSMKASVIVVPSATVVAGGTAGGAFIDMNAVVRNLGLPWKKMTRTTLNTLSSHHRITDEQC